MSATTRPWQVVRHRAGTRTVIRTYSIRDAALALAAQKMEICRAAGITDMSFVVRRRRP